MLQRLGTLPSLASRRLVHGQWYPATLITQGRPVFSVPTRREFHHSFKKAFRLTNIWPSLSGLLSHRRNVVELSPVPLREFHDHNGESKQAETLENPGLEAFDTSEDKTVHSANSWVGRLVPTV